MNTNRNLGRAARWTPILMAAPFLFLAPTACDGSSPKTGDQDIDAGQPELQSVVYGRLVDIYAYQRIDETRGDRRDQLNRRRVLVETDVVVRASLETDQLYDAAGEENPTASYEFLPFDIRTGHDELMIRWDNRGEEAARFEAALSAAQLGLTELPASYRGQNTTQQPMPVVPRDAALVLRFSGQLGVDQRFFVDNEPAVQLLEFSGDPNVVGPVNAFRGLERRIIVRGNELVLDPTILGGEAQGGFLSAGLPLSLDQATANIRIAIPSRGGVSSAFFVRQDEVPALNDLDSYGRDAIIRDFRSGNQVDGPAGVLRDQEPPMIVGSVTMGITDVDPVTGVITLNKRGHAIPVRGRFPFAAGALSLNTGFALGPGTIPTTRPLRAGDFLTQTVSVVMPDSTLETVAIRAEIVQNLDVGTFLNDPSFPGLGLASDGTQGTGPTARVLVRDIRGRDSLGRPVAFVANSTPAGQQCELARFYYEHVRFTTGSDVVSDTNSKYDFLRIEPPPPTHVGGLPVPPGERVDPMCSVALAFSEPMDFQRIDATRNLVLTDATMPGPTFAEQLAQPKLQSAGVVPVRWSDQSGDGSVLQLQPPKGLFHLFNATTDVYWFHLLLGSNGLTDLSGNPVALFNDDPSTVINNWSVRMTLDPQKGDNWVGWHTYPFEAADEDGTPFGSIDLFGQYRLLGGRLVAAEAVRFRKTADDRNLGTISRTNRGECISNNMIFQPNTGGVLYATPRMLDQVAPPSVPVVYPDYNTVNQPVGHVVEPHQPRGSRMQMRYLEDDFGLNYRAAGDMVIDVEQLFWSPFADFDVLFDVFDRYTMALAHSDKRPDMKWVLVPGTPPNPDICRLVCNSMNSSLSTTFSDNLLRGSSATTVFEDAVYRINPNNMFRSPEAVKYIAYPHFERTYTWRDSRLVTVDSAGNVVGLCGARDPQPADIPNDWTTDVDSPWVPSVMPNPPPSSGIFVLDEGDFRGDRKRDHDPIASPLLVDFKVFPDSAANTIANGSNGFQMAMLGLPSAFLMGNPGGYYNMVPVGCPQPDPWPLLRVHTTGGLNPTNLQEILVDPANTLEATGGWLKDAGAIIMIGTGATTGNGPQGIFRAPPGDGMMNWASADFLRRVSTVTFGFFDTMRPNQRAGALDPEGYPDFTVNGTNSLGNLRILDFASLLDPPLSQQPVGTSIVLELRGAQDFTNSGTLYNPTTNDTVAARGNLLNPNYACEAYRYSQPNSGAAFDSPRIAATGLTAYVTEDRISQIRNPLTGLLPRYINFRLVMTNNVQATPTVSPSLRSMSVVYRMQRE